MKQKRWKRGAALALSLMLAAVMPGVSELPLGIMDSYAYTGSATVKAASLNVRSGAGTGYAISGKLSAGAAVTIVSQQTGTDSNQWYQIQYRGSDGSTQTGYVSASYIRIPVTYTTDSDFESYLNSQGFPESYKEGLRQLHAQYPNWVFKAQKTGLDWDTVIANESQIPRSLVSSGSISSWKSLADGAYSWDNSSWVGYDGSNWVAASEEIIEYYMDPRNFLDDTYVFQFLSQEYNASVHTREGLEALVKDSFLSGTTDSLGTNSSGTTTGPSGTGSSSSNKGPGKATSNSNDSVTGPGVSGTSSSQSTQSSSASESSGGAGMVSLEGPHAAVSPKEKVWVGVTVSLEGPGSSQSTTSSGSTGTVSPGSTGTDSTGTNSTGTAPGGTTAQTSGSASYVDLIMQAGEQSGVSPYVLAAMIIQEQGTKGTSPLISGTCSGYEGYYNFFNVEAYQSGSMTATQRGLWYASQSGSYGRPWNTVEKSILGGAINYGTNYVNAGQNTFYLKKFNVQGSNLYKHQYMSNIQAAASEGAKVSQAYTADMKNTALEFIIPIFNNMPEQSCQAPTGDGSPNNKLASVSVDGFTLTPTFNRDTEVYNLIVDSSVSTLNVQASAADSSARIGGTGSISLGSGNTDVVLTVTAENGAVRTYTIHVGKQSGAASGSTGSTTPSSGSSSGPGGSASGSGGSSSGPGGSGAIVITLAE